MGRWYDPRDQRAGGPDYDPWRRPEEDRYLGLTATQFNLAFLLAVAAAVVGVWMVFFNGMDTVRGYLGGEEEKPALEVRAPSQKPAEKPAAATPTATATAVVEEGSGSYAALLETFDPLSVVTGPSSGQAEPPSPSDDREALKALLLREEDLPQGFFEFGEFSFRIPTEYGQADMVANMLVNGDVLSGDLGTMVMSAVVAGPPEAVSQVQEVEGTELTQEEIEELEGFGEEVGIQFRDVRSLDASGLGDTAVGMHMEIDFSGFAEALSALDPEGGDSFPTSIAWDMYFVVRGDKVLMLMVMWPAERLPGADSRTLVEILDARAAGY